uniref:Uncharacterized protein n=1 Tax=Alexandrium monilatum TaxID=311494 RepID=A0A7S4R164_9DINO|mmetsp:Transcript_32333/g.100898  ORF Transcript_32333/g.100898 Transcript_32333/m.100898 type:complete len:110 (-) Transcript_32333:48-377(-)
MLARQLLRAGQCSFGPRVAVPALAASSQALRPVVGAAFSAYNSDLYTSDLYADTGGTAMDSVVNVLVAAGGIGGGLTAFMLAEPDKEDVGDPEVGDMREIYRQSLLWML